MRSSKIIIGFVLFTALVFVNACKKDSQTPPTNNPPVVIDPEVEDFLNDQFLVNAQLNELAWLASLSMESCPIITGDDSVAFNECGVTSNVVNVAIISTATLTFNGTACNGYSRTGRLYIDVWGTDYWKDRGTQVMLTFDNLKITRLSDRKSITLNNQAYFENVSGGLIQTRGANDSLVFLFDPIDLTISYDDGIPRNFLGTRRIKRTTDSRGEVIAVSGLSVVNAKNSVLQHGVTRTSQNYWLSSETPLVFAEGCNYRASEGAIKFQTNGIDGSVRLGVNAEGRPQACPGATEAYHYQVEWQRQGDTTRSSVVVPY